MRLAFLTHEPFHPPSGGGSAEAVYLVAELVRRGHQVEVFCPQFEGAAEAASRFGCAFHLFTGWRMGRYTRFRNLKYLFYPGRLESLVYRTASRTGGGGRSSPWDVILAQHTISAVAAGRLGGRLRARTVFNYLDYLTGFMETWPVWVIPPAMVRALTRFELSLPRRYSADGVMTVSTPLAERLAAGGYPSDRIQPIHYGFDPGLFHPFPVEPPAVGQGPLVVMHGSFDRHHLGAIALAAMIGVYRRRPDVRIRLVGKVTAGLSQFVARLTQACPSVRVELTGFKPYAEVAQQIATADVGLVPYEESNGTHCAFVAKAVEYLGCGVPVASTPLENLCRYFADEPAIAFSRFEGADLAATVLSWLERPRGERQVLGMRASERVARELAWPRVTGRAVDFVEHVALATQRKVG